MYKSEDWREWAGEFLDGVALFNSGRFFETHEVWEEIWRRAPSEDRDFYQGMIHLTVALYQARRANWRAAHSQMRRAERRLARYEPRRGGLDISALRAAVAAVVARLEVGQPVEDFPRINLPAADSRESLPAPTQSPPPAGKPPKS